MSDAEEFTALRPYLFSVAYRILGSAAEAEDVVQESWLRWEGSDAVVESPRAFLTTVVTRLAVDVLRSARVRREQYVGHWLPEPVFTDSWRGSGAAPESPDARAELTETLDMASLLLLERLSPLERAVFVLREVFELDYAEIAATVDRSEASCRQLAARSRRHMTQGQPRYTADPQRRRELAERFAAAFQQGDVDGLREMLAAEATMVGDGGGKAPSLARPVQGRDKVAQLLGSVGPTLAAVGVRLELREVNGEPGIVTRTAEGELINVVVLELGDDGIHAIRSVSNPDKLRHLGPVSDIHAVQEQFRQAQREARGSQEPMSQERPSSRPPE